MLVDVETESEKIVCMVEWGNTLCNPYIQGTTVPCDRELAVVRLGGLAPL